MIQQFSGATVIRGYVVKIFGEVFNRVTVKMLDNNVTTLCECDCTHGQQLSLYAYLSAIGIIKLAVSLSLTYDNSAYISYYRLGNIDRKEQSKFLRLSGKLQQTTRNSLIIIEKIFISLYIP